MIKQSCRHCKSSKSVDKATVGKSIKLQASIAKTGEDFAGKPERETRSGRLGIQRSIRTS